MGLFKSIISGALGDTVKDALNSDTAKSALNAAKKKMAKTAMEAAAEKATEAAVGAAVGSATNALFRSSKKNPLQTPPPPQQIPVPQQTMSVMVAVNGQQYGPYERTTLLEMIIKGTLTPQTYVFIQGMSEWRLASEVPEVNVLFSTQAPPPPTPPAPWANAPKNQPAQAEEDNTLSPRLNKLINAAVADGEISDLERQVLIRNAQEEGVSMDEFVMVLEAKLFEQQQKLREAHEERARKEKMTDAHVNATIQKAAPAPTSKPLTKCPHCGAPVKALATVCPDCGNDYPTEVSTGSAWDQLVAKLEAIDAKYGTNNSIINSIAGLFQESKRADEKVQAINNHSIPNSKRDIFDFFTYCAPFGKKTGLFSGNDSNQLKINKAYRNKAQQVLIKARVVLKGDNELLEQLEAIAKQYKIKA